MEYISTRSQAAPLPFRETVLAGMAPDGGLFVPESVPDVRTRLNDWQALPFTELFQRIVSLYMGDTLPEPALQSLVQRSFASFADPQVTPVRPVGDLFVCELFHGPTFAFKDVALQFLGNLFEALLKDEGRRLTIAGATSGDTGSAAIHALKGRERVEVFILFPKGRVSPMQERQMTTVPDANVHALAVDGSFDDAQDIVKALFADEDFAREVSLGAVNSINWARVMAQITYFFFAYFRTLEQLRGSNGGADHYPLGTQVRFSVPTGNFGHLYAGLLAKRMGLPVERLILATNANDILHRFVQDGVYARGGVQHTHSPSMDIQVASNFERYLFDLSGGVASRVRGWMDSLRTSGRFAVGPSLFRRVGQEFLSSRVDDAETLETIRRVHADHGYLLDPHSAVAYRAAEQHQEPGLSVISMATAHPAKFSDAIRAAIDQEPPLPDALAALEALPTRVTELPADVAAVRDHLQTTLAGVPA